MKKKQLLKLLIAVALLVCTVSCSKNTTKDADTVYVNGNIYTVNESEPWATAMVIKDGKFIYVGDDETAKTYSGEVIDLNNQFVMPGIVDSHIHLAWGSQSLAAEDPNILIGENKTQILELLKAYIEADPDAENYKFVMPAACLGNEKLTRDELDAICNEKPIQIVEMEQHSRWLNTKEMQVENIDEYMSDIVQGLSYCERDENGKIIGRIYEWCGMAETYKTFDKEVYENGLNKIMAEWKKWGVVAAYDAGQQANDASIDNFWNVLMSKDESGELPVYIQGSYYIYNPAQLDNAIKELKRYNEDYSSEHVKVDIMKIMMDGTMNGRTAAMFDNYADTDSKGNTLLDVDTLTNFIKKLNEEGIDLHVHTIGDRAIATVLDAVENAQKDLGEKYKIQVTCAHVESVREQDLKRFAELGVATNFTPAWFGGNCYGGAATAYETIVKILGEDRASKTHRANTIWETGALTSFSSDSISLKDLTAWNPYVGMETGITRQTPTDEGDPSKVERIPDSGDQLTLEKVIKGYTINGAKQMKLDDKLGSIEAGKDASFLVFEKSLFDIDVYDIHNTLPNQVYIKGILQ